MLLAADGLENAEIAARLDAHVDVVSRRRKRFAEEGMAGLADRKRSGRPRVFAVAVVAEVKAMACEPPEDCGVPQSRWSASDLATRAAEEGLVESVAQSTAPPAVRRIRQHLGFAVYRASHDDYQDSYLPTGQPSGTPKKPSTAPADSTSPTPPPGSHRPTPTGQIMVIGAGEGP